MLEEMAKMEGLRTQKTFGQNIYDELEESKDGDSILRRPNLMGDASTSLQIANTRYMKAGKHTIVSKNKRHFQSLYDKSHVSNIGSMQNFLITEQNSLNSSAAFPQEKENQMRRHESMEAKGAYIQRSHTFLAAKDSEPQMTPYKDSLQVSQTFVMNDRGARQVHSSID